MQAKKTLLKLALGSILIAPTQSYAKAVKVQNSAPQALYFIENKGQVTNQFGSARNDVDFRVQSSGLTLFVGNGSLHYQWVKSLDKSDDGEMQPLASYRMDVTLIGANAKAQLIKEQQQDYYERYYLPRFGEKGSTAQSFTKITYKEIYPSIDWVLYQKGQSIEYDFVVRPGGKVSDIKLRYEGATKLDIDNAGRLIANTPMGSVRENAPISYELGGREIASAYSLEGNVLKFNTSNYAGTLIIDPTLSWSTFYGGSNAETMRMGCVAGDNAGNGFLGGTTLSTNNIATTGSYQDTITGNLDVFIAKFNASGTRKWATYFGGTAAENTYGIAVDTSGNVYLSGYTSSASAIASTSSYQTTLGGSTDAFLAKFDTAGVKQWSTYYGGSAAEQGLAVSCDRANNVYLTGYTQSTAGIATTGSAQATLGGGMDAFVVKFNSAGVRKWATYLGGTSTDQGLGIGNDNNLNVYLTGYTQSTAGIASAAAYQAAYGGSQDGFLTKFDSSGMLQWSTYYGGTGGERSYAVGCDGSGNVYMAGTSASTTGVATTGAFQDTLGGSAGDAFLVKFSSNGQRRWGTYFGGSAAENGYALSVGPFADIYLAGSTLSASRVALTGTFQDTLMGSGDAFLAKFDTTGSRTWSTYFGGDAGDIGYGVFCNSLSKVFIGGSTTSTLGLSTTGSSQSANGGGTADGFLARFDDCKLTPPTIITGYDTLCRSGSYTFSTPLITGAISYTWSLPSGWIGTSGTNSITFLSGNNSDTISVAANFACGISNYKTRIVTVSAKPTIAPGGIQAACFGDSVLLTASTGSNYLWLRNGSAIPGANNQTYYASVDGRYNIVSTSSIGCVDTSVVDTFIVHPLPVPIITASGQNLTTGNYPNYQWNRNGTPITGATSPNYLINVTSGNYTVTVVDSNGCKGTSQPFDAATLSVGSTKESSIFIKVYPNPTADLIYFDTKATVDAQISSMEGKVVLEGKNISQLDLSSLSRGIYLLILTNRNGGDKQTEKVIKN